MPKQDEHKSKIESRHIVYTEGIKYRLKEDAYFFTGIVGYNAKLDGTHLLPNGWLHVEADSTWDGPSGPTYDTPSFMRGSLVHDKIYKFIRHKVLPIKHREIADKLMRKLCKEDGMWTFRRWYTFWGVRKFALFAAEARSIEKTIKAPK